MEKGQNIARLIEFAPARGIDESRRAIELCTYDTNHHCNIYIKKDYNVNDMICLSSDQMRQLRDVILEYYPVVDNPENGGSIVDDVFYELAEIDARLKVVEKFTDNLKGAISS